MSCMSLGLLKPNLASQVASHQFNQFIHSTLNEWACPASDEYAKQANVLDSRFLGEATGVKQLKLSELRVEASTIEETNWNKNAL